MIIKFNNDISLDEWIKSYNHDNMWRRNCYTGHSASVKIEYFYDMESWFTIFEDDLAFLNEVYDSFGDRYIEDFIGDLEERERVEKDLDRQADYVMRYVDNFLIRVSKLTAFI